LIEFPKTILVISLTGIGNTLLFTPALRHLAEQYPDARIDVLVEGGASHEILATNANLDEIFNLQAARRGFSCLNLVRRLHDRCYDRSYTGFPSNRPRFNIFTWCIGARERVIHSYPDCSFPTLTFLQTRTVPAVKGEHDIIQNLRLVGGAEGETDVSPDGMPRPVLNLDDSDREFARAELGRLQEDGPVVALHPGSSAGRFHMQSAKRYPAERFSEVARLLAEELGATVLVICGPDETELKPHFAGKLGDLRRGNMHFPRGGIRQIAALVEQCDLLVSNDSGMMHVGVALRTPVIALFGPTNVERTGPVWDDCRILTGEDYSPMRCFGYPFESTWSAILRGDFDCWKGLTAQKVVEVAAEMLFTTGVLRGGEVS
jgi:heptosyltransferase-2